MYPMQESKGKDDAHDLIHGEEAIYVIATLGIRCVEGMKSNPSKISLLMNPLCLRSLSLPLLINTDPGLVDGKAVS